MTSTSEARRIACALGQLFMNGYRHKENRMDVFPGTQLLHGGLSTRLPCKSMEQMHCPGVTVHFFVSWGLFHDRFRLFKFADSFIECFTNSCGIVFKNSPASRSIIFPPLSRALHASSRSLLYILYGHGAFVPPSAPRA